MFRQEEVSGRISQLFKTDTHRTSTARTASSTLGTLIDAFFASMAHCDVGALGALRVRWSTISVGSSGFHVRIHRHRKICSGDSLCRAIRSTALLDSQDFLILGLMEKLEFLWWEGLPARGRRAVWSEREVWLHTSRRGPGPERRAVPTVLVDHGGWVLPRAL